MKSKTDSHSNKHMLIMAICCILPLVLLFAASKYFGFNSNYLFWGAMISCMGMHIWMMKEHKGGHDPT